MKYFSIKLALLFLLIYTNSYSQLTKNNLEQLSGKKILKTIKTNESIKIDGILNEDIWHKLEVAKDFVMFKPGNGNPEPNNKKTEVKISYSKEAIYIAAYLFDDQVSSIPMEFTTRDNFGQADYFLVTLNPNNDSQNDVMFVVFSTGSQADAKINPNGNADLSWNAVWESAVKINNDGWAVEMKIPYAALRFPNQSEQTWGINFLRDIKNLKEEYTWNYIDKSKGSIAQYAGILTGITKIDTPLRLSFSPFTSAAVKSFNGETISDYNFGVDIKYGINDSFTLDATLIPDFSQAAFDEVELNLSPFEQNFSEKRSFFNEGTELFNKGNLFYSRRIGSTPINYNNITLNQNEVITENPDKVVMLNAVKVSGRTKDGLGIGFFNAVTEKTEATIFDTITQTSRLAITEPFANYNIIVLDQQFNKNSSVSFINTNVMRSGSARDANVSGLIFDLKNKTSTFNVAGDIKMSQIYEGSNNMDGYAGFLRLQKVSGNYDYKIGYIMNDHQFNIRDMGFQRNNNFYSYFGAVSYQIFEPTKHFDFYKISLEARVRNRFKPNDYTGNNVELNYFATTKKQLSFGGSLEMSIGKQYDYYEPRVEGRYLTQNTRYEMSNFISTDYRKKFALDARFYFTHQIDNSSNLKQITLSPRYRFNNQFSMIYSLQYRDNNNEKGRVNPPNINNIIIFGNRDADTYTNSLSGKYNFNTKAALTLSFRHNWTTVAYDSQFYELMANGLLTPNPYQANHNINFNSWNFDLMYNWEFAPGSQLTALYRNSIFNSNNNANLSFGENLDDLFNQPKEHLFSLRLIYFLDYNKLFKKG